MLPREQTLLRLFIVSFLTLGESKIDEPKKSRLLKKKVNKRGKYNKSHKKEKNKRNSPAPTSITTPVPISGISPAPITVTSAPSPAVKDLTPAPIVAATAKPVKATPVPTKKTVKAPSASPSARPTSCPPIYNCGGNRDACVLKEFFMALDGCSWNNRAGWLVEANICNWYGVTCNINGTIDRLSLYSNNLKGSLSTKVGELVNLTVLELGSNIISGTVPVELGNLKALKTLLLDNNKLAGTVPTKVCELENLSNFWSDCDGPEKERKVSCPCCTACLNSVSAAPSTSPSKSDGCYGTKMAPIKEMYDTSPAFSQSILSGTHGWFTLSKCATASLDAADFAGIGGTNNVPNDWNVYKIDGSEISGIPSSQMKLPKSMSVLTELTEVTNLNSGGLFYGSTIPADISKLSKISTFDVQNAGLTGPAPDLSKNRLMNFNLNSNSFTGTLKSPGVNVDAGGSGFFNGNRTPIKLAIDFGATNFCSHASLLGIVMAGSNIYGPLPTRLCADMNARTSQPYAGVILSNNSFTGVMPTEWNRNVDEQWPKFSNFVPSSTSSAIIDLSNNKLSGSWPWHKYNFLGMPVTTNKNRNFNFCGNGITNTMHAGNCVSNGNSHAVFKYETCLDSSQIGSNSCANNCGLC